LLGEEYECFPIPPISRPTEHYNIHRRGQHYFISLGCFGDRLYIDYTRKADDMILVPMGDPEAFEKVVEHIVKVLKT
jgi:hypothetical protein